MARKTIIKRRPPQGGRGWFTPEWFGVAINLLTLAAVVGGLWFAKVQIDQFAKEQAKNFTVKAFEFTQEPEFLHAFQRVSEVSHGLMEEALVQETEIGPEQCQRVLSQVYLDTDPSLRGRMLAQDLNQVLQPFIHVSVLCGQKFAEESILKQTHGPDLRSLCEMLPGVARCMPSLDHKLRAVFALLEPLNQPENNGPQRASNPKD
ncbi:hypothetical protein AAU61_01525 [Desulfocarbo indianensis]|nr:hypothetical protein AAU61_01525 [Desulfocarbo indianensis]